MQIQKLIALCSMTLLSGAVTIGAANSQQLLTRTEVIKPSTILTPGDNVVLITKTQSAIIPSTDVQADIHTPSLLPVGTLEVRGTTGCDTAIILPGMADMPSAQVADVLQVNTNAAVVPTVTETPAVVNTDTTIVTKRKVFRQVVPAKRVMLRRHYRRGCG